MSDFDIEKKDREVVRIALEMLVKRCDAVSKQMRSVACDDAQVVARGGGGQVLLDRMKDNDPAIAFTFPVGSAPTLKVALSLEWDAVKAVQETQGKLSIDDKETSTRSKQIERLLTDLDVAEMKGGLAP